MLAAPSAVKMLVAAAVTACGIVLNVIVLGGLRAAVFSNDDDDENDQGDREDTGKGDEDDEHK